MEENNQENNEKNNQEQESNVFKSVPTVNENQYKAFSPSKPKKEKRQKSGFGRTVALPFLCGILGAGIVVGTCVGVPTVRNQLLSQLLTYADEDEDGTVSVSDINSTFISIEEYSETAVAVAAKVKPSIVGITVEYSVNSVFSQVSSTAEAEGSGVIISEDGYILTNNHVVNSSSTSSSSTSYYEIGEATTITVTLYDDDTEYEATIVGTDEETDLAVIKIEATGLTAAELGDSDSVQVGEFCMAIGNALGLGDTVTAGIVSAVDREVTDDDGNTYVTIQTDAAINSGNSGGALVNSEGQVIGINTLKISGTGVEGVGFAIPINSTIDIYEQLIEYNKVKRPYIGIGGIDLDEETAAQHNLVAGVYVKTVEDFSAAERAGIQAGDVIIAADGETITTMDELNEIKNEHEIGDEMTLTIYRDGETKEVTVTLQEQE